MSKAKRKAVAARDNVRTVTVGGRAIEVESSLGARKVYADEFMGKLSKPYSGVLSDDLLALYDGTREFVEDEVLVTDDDGNPVTDEDGNEVTTKGMVPNPAYRGGVDVSELLRLTWAMAFAAGSVTQVYDEWMDSVWHSPMTRDEEVVLYAVVALELGAYTFRGAEGRGDAGEPDEAEAAEG